MNSWDGVQQCLHFTLQDSGIGVWTWNLLADRIEADRNCSLLYGQPLGEFPENMEGVYALVEAVDRERLRREVTASMEQGAELNTEFGVVWPDGTVHSVCSHGKVFEDEAGRPQRLTGVCWSVTERPRTKEHARTPRALLAAEDKFRALIDAVPDAMVVVNEQGRIVLVSAQAEKLFGHPRDQLLGRTIEALIPSRFNDNHPGRRTGFFADHDGSAMSVGAELYGLHQDGKEFPIEVSLSRVETEEGVLISSSIRDVSDRKRMERHVQSVVDRSDQEREERQTEQDKLQVKRDERQTLNVTRLEDVAAVSEAANRAKSTFLSTMSHEIRTPLNAILGYSQLMLRDPALGIEAQANVKIINRSGEHLLSLINDVLDMSKIEAGRVELNPVTFNLSRLLDDLENMFRLRAEAKGLHFELSVEVQPVAYLVADEGKIRQVLINLLGNAIKFTEHGKVKLRVRIDQAAAGRLRLSARVEDTGTGVSAAELPLLFQPFVQTKGGLNTQQGTGLGLAISRQHARLMGGDITVTARARGGSRFLFEIPVERGESGVTLKRGAHARVIRLRPGQEVRRILVVDDHFENRNWLMKLLVAVGFSVRGASDGEEGLRIWMSWAPRLILMDVHMPLVDGLEATRRIKADPRGANTAIIILTASALDEERRMSVQSGADDFLPKPCREDDLFESIRVLLGVAFDYETASVDPKSAAGKLACGVERLALLPRELIGKLLHATVSGNKKVLNQLIIQVRDTPGEVDSALALQNLSDKYQYDELRSLLEEACRK